MPLIVLTPKRKILLAAVSLTAALAVILAAHYAGIFDLNDFINELINPGISYIYTESLGYGIRLIIEINVISVFLAAFIVGLLPYTIVDTLNRRYIDRIERDLPNFFKGLGESIRAGTPFERAIEHVSRVTGPQLRREMERVLVKAELGQDLRVALNEFAERVGTVNVKRAVTILITAYESGGKVVDVLDAAAEMYLLIRNYENEKSTQIAPYSMTVYMAIIVFLVISLVLLQAFFVPLYELSKKGGAFMRTGAISIEAYTAILYITSILEAFFGGLVVGKLRAGTVIAGLKHVVAMETMVLIFFTFIVPLARNIIVIPVLP